MHRLVNAVIPELAETLNGLCGTRELPAPLLPANFTVLPCGCVVDSDGLSRLPLPGALRALIIGDTGYMGSLGGHVPLAEDDREFIAACEEAYASTRPEETKATSADPLQSIPYDTSSFIRLLHSHGVNMRHCGKLYLQLKCDLWKKRLLFEATCRAIKVRLYVVVGLAIFGSRLGASQAHLRHEHRHLMSTVKVASSEPYRRLLLQEVSAVGICIWLRVVMNCACSHGAGTWFGFWCSFQFLLSSLAASVIVFLFNVM